MVNALPRPEGFQSITPHMVLKDCAKALDWYAKNLDATILYSMPGPGGKIMHATIQIGDSKVMLNDDFPDWSGGKESHPLALGGSPITLHIYTDDVDAVFNKAVAGGAKSVMPVADMFWGDRYGMFTDPFGHSWAVATHISDPTPEDIEAAMKSMAAP